MCCNCSVIVRCCLCMEQKNGFLDKKVKLLYLVKFKYDYSEKELFDKLKDISKVFKKTGAKLIYPALLLYLVLIEDNTPVKVKLTIVGALGCLISPLDFVSDAILGLGFSDDFSALCLALATVSAYITDDIKKDAKKVIISWIPDISKDDFSNLDSLLRI